KPQKEGQQRNKRNTRKKEEDNYERMKGQATSPISFLLSLLLFLPSCFFCLFSVYSVYSVVALLHVFSGRKSGNRITSRMVWVLVSSMTRRSMPMPSPPAGGMPCFSARTKSSSIFAIDSSSDRPANCV